jgi:hypothetical protein
MVDACYRDVTPVENHDDYTFETPPKPRPSLNGPGRPLYSNRCAGHRSLLFAVMRGRNIQQRMLSLTATTTIKK